MKTKKSVCLTGIMAPHYTYPLNIDISFHGEPLDTGPINEKRILKLWIISDSSTRMYM